MRKRNSFIVFIFFLLLANLYGQSVNVPLTHWSYRFLERMEMKGVVQKIRDGSKPFSRKQMVGFIEEIIRIDRSDPKLLSRVEKQYLQRIQEEFLTETSDSTNNTGIMNHEPHFYSWQYKDTHLHLDLVGGSKFLSRSRGLSEYPRQESSGYYGAILRGEFQNIGFYSDTRIHGEWGAGGYRENYDLSAGYPTNANKDSSIATWDESQSYLCYNYRSLRLEAGRDRISWGPALGRGLILSGDTPVFDLVKVEAYIGCSTVSFFHGELRSSFGKKWIAGKRFELSVANGIDAGYSETVIYGMRGIEGAYLNPLLPVLVAEHTLGDRDNVAMGFDLKLTRFRGIKLFGELLIDDLSDPWNLFKTSWENKTAFILGSSFLDPLKLPDSRVSFEYTRINPYVYSHNAPINRYEHYDYCLGSDLQPNSERLLFIFDYNFNFSCRTSFHYLFQRHGTGTIIDSHREDEVKTAFLEGMLEEKREIMINVDLELIRDCWLRLQLGWVKLENQDYLEGNDSDFAKFAISSSLNW